MNVVATAYAADPSADPWAALKRQPGPRKRRTAAAAATTISSPSVAAVIPGEGAVPEIVPARSNTNAPSSPQSDTSKQVNSCKGAYTADIGSDSNSRNEIAGNERAIRPLVGQTAKHSTSSTPHQEVKEEEDEEVDGDEQDWAKGPSGQLEWRPLSLRRQMARQEREARAVPSPTEVQAFTTALRSASPTKTSPKPPDAAGSSDSASASNSSADASPSAAMATTNAATMPTQEELQVAARVAAASAAENAAVRAAAAAADYDDEHEAKATSEEARTSRLPSPPPPDAPPAAVTTEETVAAADDDQSHHELPLPLEQREELVANQALHDDDGDGDGAVWEDAVPLAENKEEHGEASNDKQDSKKYDNATEELQQAKSVANYGSDEFDEDDDTDGEDEEDLAPPPPRAAPVPPVVPVLPVDTTTNTTTATTDTPTAADTAITTAAVEPHEESSSSPQPRDTPSPPALYDRASKELSKNTSEEASTPADNSSNSNEGSDSSGSGSSSNGGNRGEGEDRGRGRQSNNGGGRGDEGGGGGDERSSDEGTSEGGGNESGSGGNGRGGDKGEDDGPPDEPTRAGAPAEAETAEAETGDDDDNDGDKKGDMTKVKDEKENKGESAPINENTAATKLQCLQRGRDVRKASDQQLSRRQSTSASGTAPFPVPDDTADLVSNDAPSSVAGDGVGAAAANDSNDSVGGGPEAAVGDLEASPALNLAADLANAAKASAALAERGEEEDPLSPEQKLAQEAEAHVEKLLGRLDTLEGRKGTVNSICVCAQMLQYRWVRCVCVQFKGSERRGRLLFILFCFFFFFLSRLLVYSAHHYLTLLRMLLFRFVVVLLLCHFFFLGDSSDLRVRAAQESQLAKQQFADASAQISRASADPDGDARATLAEAGRLLLDQALASDQLSAQHLSEADAFDKGFNREVREYTYTQIIAARGGGNIHSRKQNQHPLFLFPIRVYIFC